MSQFFEHWVTSHPKVLAGKPVIVGTRIPIDSLAERLSTGETVEQLSQAFPHVPREALTALSEEYSLLSPEQLAEIERRTKEVDAGLVQMLPWDEVRTRVHAQVFGTRPTEE